MKNFFLSVLLLLAALSGGSQIISYPINQQINGPGILYFDFDSSSQDDFYFEVIELSQNVFAARVNNVGFSSYLDNSTFHYPDALDAGDTVMGYFNNGDAVLGTFTGAGLFSGAGDKFLGIKIFDGVYHYYGWVKLNCNATNDTLKIISCGFNSIAYDTITAGQTVVNTVEEINSSSSFLVFPNPASRFVTFQLADHAGESFFEILDLTGKKMKYGSVVQKIDISELPAGIYIARVISEKMISEQLFVVK